jgi:hypothetical protein
LSSLLTTEKPAELPFIKPVPQIIPANERRRAPLLVKMAIATSCQAIAASSLAPQSVACVFGSGLGDNDITDYLCKVLVTELKQISPTKFHNSVHNTAAGYWTISTECMESANSIAAYQHTAGMVMLEAVSQCLIQQQPVLITLYDMEVCFALKDVFPCTQNICLSLLIAPNKFNGSALAALTLKVDTSPYIPRALRNPSLEEARQKNPTGHLLNLMEGVALLERGPIERGQALQATSCRLSISPTTSISLQLEKMS